MKRKLKSLYYKIRTYHDNFTNPGSLGVLCTSILSLPIAVSYASAILFLASGLGGLLYLIISLYLLREDKNNLRDIIKELFERRVSYNGRDYVNIRELVASSLPYIHVDEKISEKDYIHDFINSNSFRNFLKEKFGEYYGNKIGDWLLYYYLR